MGLKLLPLGRQTSFCSALQMSILRLCNQGLTEVSIGGLSADVAHLLLSDNRLVRLALPPPLTFSSLTSLRVLDVTANLLRFLPADLPPSLEVLYAGCNQLTALPPTLPASLQILSVHRNALTSLPSILPTGLHTLVASYNHLTALPSVLPPALRHLRLDHNTLSVFPNSLGEDLTELWLEHNHIPFIDRVTIPISLLSLRLDYNRITYIHHFSFSPHIHCTLEGNPLPLPHNPDKEPLYDYLVRLIKHQEAQMQSWY